MINKGNILISEPYLGDPNFERSVVLVCEKNNEGTLGFVLNKPSLITFDTVMKNADDFKEVLFIGGPVAQDSLHFIYRNRIKMEGSIEISQNLYWGGNFEELMQLIRNKKVKGEDFRFFLGYSGWGEGQLDQELEQNSWIVTNTTADEIFDVKAEELWREILKNMGGKYKMKSNYPIDPRLN
jgi:putative transcriptional regulator